MKKFNLDTLVRNNIKALKPYASARDEFKGNRTDMVFLDANENPFPSEVNRYPDPKQRILKKRLAKLRQCKSDQILLGNGSDEVLDLLVRAFCEPGLDNIITLPPTYGMYGVTAAINDIENQEVLLTSDFQPDFEKIKKRINKTTRIIFLCSPNNPTGNTIDANVITQLLEVFNGLVVVDEAYIDFSKQKSWVQQLEKWPNLVVIQTLSKAFGMAGIRLGICYASHQIITVLDKIKPPYNVNELTQRFALNALNGLKKYRYETYAIIKERERLSELLLTVNCVEKVYSTEANFFMVKVDDAVKRYNQLLNAGIVVRNRSKQPGCQNCLRFTIGTTQENDLLINTLKKINHG